MALPRRNNVKEVLLKETPEGVCPTKEELEVLIKKYAPVIYFQEGDDCMPVTVEWYLQRAWLVNGLSRARVPATINNLPSGTENAGTYYLEPKEGTSMAKSPDEEHAKAYVHVQAINTTHTDLQYWFFYGQTGPASALVKWLIDEIKGHEGKINLNPLGKTNGAWERIAVRINNATLVAEEVFFAHGKSGQWMPFGKLQTQGTQPIVYAARGSCAFYPQPGVVCSEKLKFDLFSSRLEFCLLQETAPGFAINFSDSCELISAEHLGENKPTEPEWLKFQGHWGHPNPEYLTVSSIKRIVLSTFGKTLEFLLSRNILDELVNYLLSHFAYECRNRLLTPRFKDSWELDH
jgi:hypothetical protein